MWKTEIIAWSIDEDDVVPEKRAAVSRPQESDARVRAEAARAQCVGDRAEAVATEERDCFARHLLLFGRDHQLRFHLARAFHLDEAT